LLFKRTDYIFSSLFSLHVLLPGHIVCVLREARERLQNILKKRKNMKNVWKWFVVLLLIATLAIGFGSGDQNISTNTPTPETQTSTLTIKSTIESSKIIWPQPVKILGCRTSELGVNYLMFVGLDTNSNWYHFPDHVVWKENGTNVGGVVLCQSSMDVSGFLKADGTLILDVPTSPTK
jgi:hypothetical protein